MYKTEILVESELFDKARTLSDNPDKIRELKHALDVYLNHQPGKWRLISHSATIEALPYDKVRLHYFVWATGD